MLILLDALKISYLVTVSGMREKEKDGDTFVDLLTKQCRQKIKKKYCIKTQRESDQQCACSVL